MLATQMKYTIVHYKLPFKAKLRVYRKHPVTLIAWRHHTWHIVPKGWVLTSLRVPDYEDYNAL